MSKSLKAAETMSNQDVNYQDGLSSGGKTFDINNEQDDTNSNIFTDPFNHHAFQKEAVCHYLFIALFSWVLQVNVDPRSNRSPREQSRNLCPRFPYSSINNNLFIKGHGLPVTTIPTTQHPAGIVIQKPSGFWTNIRTTSDTRTIQDSGGNSYNLPNQNRMVR